MKNNVAKSVLLCLAGVLAICFTGCPPTTQTFTIKLTNTGQYAITGAYFTATEKDWGDNLLSAPLGAGATVYISNVPYVHYDFLCTFDGNDQENNPASLQQLDNWPPGHDLDCVTWEAAYSSNGDWFFGYNWGCTD